MTADSANMRALSLSPMSRPVAMVGLSPALAPYLPHAQPYFLSSPHPFPLATRALSKDDDDGADERDGADEASDLFDAHSASFSLYHSAEQDDGPAVLSPNSAASLSPPSHASSASSVASSISSSSSPPPLCAACSCCSTARRLSALVAGLKQKTAHTQSLVTLFQQTQQRLEATEQQLEQLTARYSSLAALHQQAEAREAARSQEEERRQVRLQAHESHIVQLKAALSKAQSERDERTEREKSIKALQREKETLIKQTNTMRAQLAAAGHTTAKQRTDATVQEQAQTAATGARDDAVVVVEDVEWLPDTTAATTPPAAVTSARTDSHATAPAAASPVAAVSSESDTAMFDVSRTMALAEAAISALKSEVRKRNDVIKQMRAEQREYRRAMKEAGVALPPRTAQLADTRKRRRKDSKPERAAEAQGEEMQAEELDAFAADVMDALTQADEEGARGQRVTREGMGGSVLTADGQEVAEEARAEGQKAEVVEQPVVVKRKRGRPRIHPIKEKTTVAVRRGSRRRTVKAEATSECSTSEPQPSSTLTSDIPSATIPLSPSTASTVAARQPPPIVPKARPLPHQASAVFLQQASALLRSLLHAATSDEAELVSRCLAMVCDCPCSSNALPLLPSPLPASMPLPFAVPALSPAFSSVAVCRRCTSSDADGTALSVCCRSDSVLHWDDVSAVALRLCSADSGAPLERWTAVVRRLDEALASRHKQLASDDEAAPASLLQLLSYQATAALLAASTAPHSAPSPYAALFPLLLHITRSTTHSAYVALVILSLCCSSQPTLSLLESVAQLHPQLLTHSPAQRTFHIKTMRLITAAHLSLHEQPAPTSASTASGPASASAALYPSLSALLSSELSSLSSASRDFVFGRLQSELILHASVTNFTSPQHYQTLSASLLASFHLLLLHLTFPAAQSLVMSTVLPAVPKAKSPLNSLVLLLTLPSLIACAVQHLAALALRRPRPRKEESYTRAQVAAVLHHAMEGMEAVGAKPAKGQADSGLLLRGGGCEVLLRALDEMQRRREVKVLKDDEDARVLRAAVDGWVSGLSEAEVAAVCPAVEDDKKVSGWELLAQVRGEVRDKRLPVAA